MSTANAHRLLNINSRKDVSATATVYVHQVEQAQKHEGPSLHIGHSEG